MDRGIAVWRQYCPRWEMVGKYFCGQRDICHRCEGNPWPQRRRVAVIGGDGSYELPSGLGGISGHENAGLRPQNDYFFSETLMKDQYGGSSWLGRPARPQWQ